jgi:hypothetical protein
MRADHSREIDIKVSLRRTVRVSAPTFGTLAAGITVSATSEERVSEAVATGDAAAGGSSTGAADGAGAVERLVGDCTGAGGAGGFSLTSTV